MTPLSQAIERLTSLVRPVGSESVSLIDAADRVLRETPHARRTQPPFDASSMDGVAVRAADATAGARLALVGEIAAGGALDRPIGPQEAARIYTGAPIPIGADAVVIQEDVDFEGDAAVIRQAASAGDNIRPAGGDFGVGDAPIDAPKRLSAEDVALLAAMGWPWIAVARKPRVALLAIGDELALPGEPLGASDIVSSNGFGVAALIRRFGGAPSLSPIAPDDLDALRAALRAASGFDLIVTLGGASDGAHDLSRPAVAAEGGSLDFYKVAMRPGKPIAAGALGQAIVLGLPGNPVSSMVGARLILPAVLDAFLGLEPRPPRRERLPLAAPLGQNGPREHFMRARLLGPAGQERVAADPRQDSSLLTVLARAGALIVRPIDAPAADIGDLVDVIRL